MLISLKKISSTNLLLTPVSTACKPIFPLILLSNNVDYCWWFFSQSRPTRVPSHILFSNKAAGISRVTRCHSHQPVFQRAIRNVSKLLLLITEIIIGQSLTLWHKETGVTFARASFLIYPEQSVALWDTTSGCIINTLRQKHHCHLVLSWHCHFIVMAVRSAVLMSCSTVYVTDVAVIRAAACEGLSPQPQPSSRSWKVIAETPDDGDGSDGMRHGSTKPHFSHRYWRCQWLL